MGHRHHYLVVLLYSVLGLIAGDAHAQSCGDSVTECGGCVQACDEGQARDAAERQREYLACIHPTASGTRVETVAGSGCGLVGGGVGALFRAQHQDPQFGNWVTQGTYRYTILCTSRDPVQSSASSCPGSPESCLTCKNGCQYSETLHLGAVTSVASWGAYTHTATGQICNYADDPPEPHPEPPDDPPCEGTMVGTLCITPYHFCAGNNCVQHPPPPTCAYGNPTLCVGNPPPPPNPDTPPGPDPDPCAEGTATANGNSYGVNIHCIDDEPPPSDECQQNPQLPQCQPPDEGDESFCEANPQHVDCQTYCQQHPNEEICGGEGDEETFCEENPSHPSCQGSAFCNENPTHPSCQQGDYCTQHPTSPICQYCDDHPEQEVCGGQGTCASNPSDPACQFCALHPNDPVCENSGNTCQDNPQHPSCEDDDNNASGGGTCGAAPVCTGDSILCNSLHQQWQARCQLEKLTGEGEEPEEIDGDAGDHYEETMIGSDMLDTSGFLGGGGCPAISFNLNFFGASQAVDPLWCQILPWLGWLVVAAATVTAVRIIGGG